MADILKLGEIYSVIRQNPDRTRDQIYMKAIPNTGNTCKNCYMYKRFDRNTREKLCNKCVNTLTETGLNVMFEFISIKFQ